MTTHRDEAPAGRRAWAQRPLWQVGAAAALVAAAVSILFYIGARAGGVPMELTEVFEDRFARMPVMNMAWAALLDGGVVGTVLAVVCRRWTRRPRLSFMVLTTIGLIASFVLPIGSDATIATKVVLSISHVLVAAIIVPALALALPTRRPGTAPDFGMAASAGPPRHEPSTVMGDPRADTGRPDPRT